MMGNIPNDPFEQEPEYPLQPYYHPLHRVTRRVYDFLASAKLAMFLLVVILVCCVTGVTVFRGGNSWNLIFSQLWFHGLLVLLVVNIACCFFGRIWRRRITVISFGMILFHLSFVGMLLGIVFNSLYSFEGMLRLTEGETLPNNAPESYDFYNHGRFFSFSRLTGETQLVKLHWGYKDRGSNKAVAYEIAVTDGMNNKQGIIYVTKNLDFKGVWYFPEKEGYAPLVVLQDDKGNDLYGAFVPLQTLKQQDGTRIVTTGTKNGPTPMDFPKAPEKALFYVQMLYTPSQLDERGGEVAFRIWPPGDWNETKPPIASGKADIHKTFAMDGYRFNFREMRYWVGMRVRHDPGKPFILACLWVGLAGMIITTAGRMMRGNKSRN